MSLDSFVGKDLHEMVCILNMLSEMYRGKCLWKMDEYCSILFRVSVCYHGEEGFNETTDIICRYGRRIGDF